MSWSKNYTIAGYNLDKLDAAVRADATIGDAGAGWIVVAFYKGETVNTFVTTADATMTIRRDSTPTAGEIAALDAVVATYDTTASTTEEPVSSFMPPVVTGTLGAGWTRIAEWVYKVCAEAPGADDGHAKWMVRCIATASGTGAELRIVEDDLSATVDLTPTPAAIPDGGPAFLEFGSTGNMPRSDTRAYYLEGRIDGAGGPAVSASVSSVMVCLVWVP